ncbi:DMT family transporter [Szabonella alba]|nr:DMT family transporter [Szabonella alba]
MAARPLIGILWMLGSGLAFVGVTGSVRWLGTDLPAVQSAFLRFAWGVVFLLPALWTVLRAGMPAQVWKLNLGRGLIHTGAVVLWFYAMARLPVAEVTAIGFLNPVLVTVGAALMFGEGLALRRILAIGVAILGALIVLRPGFREIGEGHFAQIGAAFCFAGSYLFAKRLTQVLDAGAVVAVLSGLVTLGLAPFALAVWVPVTWGQLVLLAFVALFATAGHYCMTRAFAAAPMAVTQPVVFLQLVWATLLGALVFSEGVDGFVILGGGVIIASVSYMAWREHRLRRRVTPAPGAGQL